MFNTNQVHWALDHDWCISADSNEIVVRHDYDSGKDLTFTSFNALYEWAGY